MGMTPFGIMPLAVTGPTMPIGGSPPFGMTGPWGIICGVYILPLPFGYLYVFGRPFRIWKRNLKREGEKKENFIETLKNHLLISWHVLY
jgi:hypothetical protein